MLRFSIIFASISGFLAVALGAFGAHALKTVLSPAYIEIWHTAVLYQFIHTIAILALVALSPFVQTCWQKRSLIFFSLGIVLFSGSLYMLTLLGLNNLGIITPIGGCCFLIAWICFAVAAIKNKQN